MTRSSKTLLAALLAGTALTTAAWAQFGGGPMVPPAGPAGMPMPMNGGPNVPGGDPMRMMGRMPFANGTVTAVDAAAGTVTLTPMFGGSTPQTVRATDATQISATREGTVGDLKVGDTIQVRGVPTGITASQITAGDSADQPGGSMMGGSMSLPQTGTRLGGRPGVAWPGMGGAQPAWAQASGKITGLSPLTVSLSDGVAVTLKAGQDVKVSRNVTEKVGDLKVGDRIMANGTAGDDGVFAATRIRVNVDIGMGFGVSPLPR